MDSLDPILLGDNQFFGVNHLAPEKGRETEARFKDLAEIRKVMYLARDHGVNAVFFSTHPAIYQITEMMQRDKALKEMAVYVNVPYVSKYVRMLSERGMIGTVKTMLMGKSILGSARFCLQGAFAVLTQRYVSLTNRLIDVEMGPFKGMNVKAIFLHDSLTGLASAYKMTNVIRNFHDYVRKEYGVIPAFGTLNYPFLCRTLENAGIDHAVVMCGVNKLGYFMNPSRLACEEAITSHKHTIVAMSTLAAGSLAPDEAYEYLFSLKKVRHVVVGLSSKTHAEETFRVLYKYLE